MNLGYFVIHRNIAKLINRSSSRYLTSNPHHISRLLSSSSCPHNYADHNAMPSEDQAVRCEET